MRVKALAIGLGLIVIASTIIIGASAFTAATLKRDANIDVVTDSKGPLSLSAGATGIETTTSGGEVKIDVSALSGAKGINVDSTYSFGNESDIASTSESNAVDSNDYVFAITNNDGYGHDVTITYTSSNALSKKNVNLTVVDNDGGTAGGKVTVQVGSSNSATITIPGGDTVYVVPEFNSGLYGANDIDKASSLNGTIKLEV